MAINISWPDAQQSTLAHTIGFRVVADCLVLVLSLLQMLVLLNCKAGLGDKILLHNYLVLDTEDN